MRCAIISGKIIFNICNSGRSADLPELLFHGKSCSLCRERSRGTGLRAFIKFFSAGDAPLVQRQGGVFRVPLPASGLHPPRNEKGAARPFQTPKLLGSIQKIQVAPLKDFLCCADFKAPQSLRDSSPQGSERQQMQLLATAPSREKANQE